MNPNTENLLYALYYRGGNTSDGQYFVLQSIHTDQIEACNLGSRWLKNVELTPKPDFCIGVYSQGTPIPGTVYPY